jgi:hypothetical protein
MNFYCFFAACLLNFVAFVYCFCKVPFNNNVKALQTSTVKSSSLNKTGRQSYKNIFLLRASNNGQNYPNVEDEEEEPIKEANYRDSSDLYNRQSSKSRKKASTFFSRVIDDFVGKRYGAGEAFYGKRTSVMSEEGYAEFKQSGQKESQQSLDVAMNELLARPLQPNAVLLSGMA